MKTYLYLIILFTINVPSQVHDRSWRYIINEKDSNWFASDDAKAIAENVLLYQRDIGGWPKNIPMHKKLSEEEKENLKLLKSYTNEVTFDNGATIQEMLFLSKIYDELPDERYQKAFLLGLNYILAAQYDNGGWPQFYPLRQGYYSHITYNDDSMVNILKLLKEIKDETGYYSIKPSNKILKKVKKSFEKGIDCILRTQYTQNGVLTAWCAQHDAVTLKPTKARSYELPSLIGKESAQIVMLLMSIEDPSAAVKNSIVHAVNWFDKVKISGLEVVHIYEDDKRVDKKVVSNMSADPIWARFMELEDNTPFYSDRDGIKLGNMPEIGKERRKGYAWYTREPQELLDNYVIWEQKYIKDYTTVNKYITVAKDGSGDFKSIQGAINSAKAFPYERITIFVKNGIYKEKVKIHEWNPNLSLIGESKEKHHNYF